MLEGSLLLVLCPLLGVGWLCLSLLRWSRLERLPMLRGGRWGSIHFHVLVLPHILFACICAYCGCCVCTSLAAGPPFPTDAIWNCSEFTAACMNSLWDLAAALSSRYFAVASFNPSSARWRSSRSFVRPCGTPIPLFARRRRSAATNAVRRWGDVLRFTVRIYHSLQSRGYNPDL